MTRRGFRAATVTVFLVAASSGGESAHATGGAGKLKAGPVAKGAVDTRGARAPKYVPPGTTLRFAPSVVSRDGITLSRALTFDRVTSQSSETLTMAQGAELVFEVRSTAKANVQEFQFRYGASVRGIRTATVSTTDGVHFQGKIDGRAFTATNPQTMSQVSFGGGAQPVPAVFPDAVKSVGPQLWRDLTASLKAPRPTQLSPATSPPMSTLDQRSSDERDPRPPAGWVMPVTTTSGNCDKCFERANDHYVNCWFLTETNVLETIGGWLGAVACPVCFAAHTARCLLVWSAEMIACNGPGGGCCPNPCGLVDNTISGTCCGADTTCMGRNGPCCPAGRAICNGFCCPAGTPCAEDGFCGCPGGRAACGDLCCQAGLVCNDGLCTQPNGCMQDQAKCGNTCCNPFSVCCNGACCVGGCVNGACCTAERLCGHACCATGETCLDRSASRCGKPPPVDCKTQITGTRACMSRDAKGNPQTICCPTGHECCGNTCCGVGKTCCASGMNGVGCFAPEACGPR